jgi:hypothetical protein
MPDRSDYDAIFDKDGPDGLTAAVRQRFNPMLADKEFRRMAHREYGRWVVANDSGGEPRVIGRRDPSVSQR